MIKLFPANETNFDTLGLAVLNKYLKECKVKEILNGNFSVDIILDYYPRIWDKIGKEMIIVVPTHRGPKAFRIVNTKIDTRYMYIYAQHIWWDLSKYLIEDINVVGKTGQEAGEYILTRGAPSLNWGFTSDINLAKNCRIVREYVLDAFMGKQDNSFKNRWGGEIECNDFEFSINAFRGNKIPRVIKYGKNVEAFEFFEDMSTVGTKLMPIAYDGLLLPEKYVESPIINSYAAPIVKKVDAKSIKLATSTEEDTEGKATRSDEGFQNVEECYKAMRELCEKLFEQGMDKPSQNVRVSIMDLSKYSEYRDYGYEHLETIGIGDVVDIEMIQYNITVRHRCISITYDALRKQYIETELGEFKLSEASIGNDFVADTSLDEELAGYYEGVYYHRNLSEFTISDELEEAAFLTYGTTRDTHLSLFVSMIYKCSYPGLLTCNIKINNVLHEFTPMQTYNAGWTTFTIAIPILDVKGGESQSMSILFSSSHALRIKVQHLQVTLRGQGVAKGGAKEPPHAEVIDKFNWTKLPHKAPLKHQEGVKFTLQPPIVLSASDNYDEDKSVAFEPLETFGYMYATFPVDPGTKPMPTKIIKEVP